MNKVCFRPDGCRATLQGCVGFSDGVLPGRCFRYGRGQLAQGLILGPSAPNCVWSVGSFSFPGVENLPTGTGG